MTFEDSQYTVVLDKGTLDAIMTDDKAACHQDVDHMFAEIARVLRFSGRYVCITLAQEHIIKKVVSHFTSMWVFPSFNYSHETLLQLVNLEKNVASHVTVCTTLDPIALHIGYSSPRKLNLICYSIKRDCIILQYE